jgi:predicted restriction endonuclease
VKRLNQIKLTAHDKAWMKIHSKKFRWSVERIRMRLQQQVGEKIDPNSIRRFLNEKELLPVSRTARGRRALIERQVQESRRINKKMALDAARAEQEGNFDPNSNGQGKQQVIRAINLRRGQALFRKKLLQAYGGRCAITGCDCQDALDAAHIVPYNGQATNHVQNGLLLRGDIHTLFDLGKIGVDVRQKRVLVANSLGKTVYATLKGKKLRLPPRAEQHPNQHVLRRHAKHWGLKLK